MTRHGLVNLFAAALLGGPLLLAGCVEDNPSEPLPPTVARITAPAADDTTLFADDPVEFRGEGIMSTGEPVYPDRLSWYLGQVTEDSLFATGAEVARSLSVGRHTVHLVAQESVNLSGRDSVTITVREPDNWDPVATIVEPLDGEDFLPAHVATVLRGTVADVDDDTHTVTWTSDLQAGLGEGAELEVALLPGVHRLIMRVTDPSGKSDADTVTVTARHRPAAPVPAGEYFFRASEFTELCEAKEILQLIGDAAITVDAGAGTAGILIDEMSGSITCATATICDLAGEFTQGNLRVTASGDVAGGGTLDLEISLFVASPTSLQGLIRGVETPPGGPACVYRSPLLMLLKAD